MESTLSFKLLWIKGPRDSVYQAIFFKGKRDQEKMMVSILHFSLFSALRLEFCNI